MALALEKQGEIVYDADLTGRPVSSTSSSYPNTAFGHMGDAIELGYQAALVSLHSPTYGRLWLANELHPGNTVSMTRTQALVVAAEKRTGHRPQRRTDLLGKRLAQAQAELEAIGDAVADSCQRHREAQGKLDDARLSLREWEQEVRILAVIYEQKNRQQTAHCQLTRAQRKVATFTKRIPRCEKALGVAQWRLTRHEAQVEAIQAKVDQLQAHYQQLQADNAANPNPIRATFRLDGGFTSHENLYWLIEMGYDVYTRGRFPKVRDALSASVTDDTDWRRVGGNAHMTAWGNTTVDGYFAYPLDVALLHYHTGERILRTAREIIKIRPAFAYTVTAGLVGGAHLGYLNSAQQVFQEQYALGELFPLFFAIIAFSIGLASFLNARLVVRYGMRFLVRRALLVIFGLSLVAIVGALLSAGQPPLWLLMAYLILVFFCIGILFGNMNALAMEPLGHIAGIGAATVGSLSTLISVLMGTMIGQSYNDTILPLVAGIAVLTGLSLVVVRWAGAE